jgi:dihydroorotate dehydrogenase electron transfer subunit
MNRIDDIEGTIVRNHAVVPGYYRASIRLSRPMPEVRPGQFVMVKIPSAEVFLRRPFSIYTYRSGVVSILYKVVGTGTRELAAVSSGTKVMVLGPLGNGFDLLSGHQPVLVAGGIGIAGIYFLWLACKRKAPLFWGCTSDADMGLLNKIMPDEKRVATIDGSFGCKGNVVELLARELPLITRPVQVLACGPEPMFHSLRDLLKDERIPCRVLLEERMACGLGICFGCVTKTLDKTEPYKRVCKEGPVFDLWQISL